VIPPVPSQFELVEPHGVCRADGWHHHALVGHAASLTASAPAPARALAQAEST